VKVLHVTQGYYPTIGGTEWLIQRISEELVHQYGDEVTVFTTNCYNGEGFFNPSLPHFPVGYEELNGVSVRRFPVLSRVSRTLRKPQQIAYNLNLPLNQYLRLWAQGPIVSGLKSSIRKFPADIIAASSFPLMHMFVSLKAAQQSHRPCVLHGGLHPQDGWGFDRPMIYQAISKANGYISNTTFETEYVVHLGANPQQVFTIGCGVDPDLYARVSPTEAKARFGFGENPVVGYIGQLGRHKGVDVLLRAMPLVWQVVPEARLLLAGARTMFTETVEKITSTWSQNDRQKLVAFYNFKEEDKPWLFSSLDVFTYPSGYESFGIAFLEAWAAGKPVIGCWRGAIPSVVSAGRDGLLVDFQDDIQLAEAIIVLLKNREWAQALGCAGKRKMLENYTWRKVASRFRQVYQQAIEEYSV
jgi:glycosyltransferase involved in cell wall biosynthesis